MFIKLVILIPICLIMYATLQAQYGYIMTEHGTIYAIDYVLNMFPLSIFIINHLSYSFCGYHSSLVEK